MTPSLLHEKLIEACEDGNVDDAKQWLAAGADPNYNIKRPANALDKAVQTDNRDMIDLLLEHGAIVKEFVLQKAIERDKNYLHLLVPDFSACTDERLLLGVLLAAINLDDVALAKQAIDQGAKPGSLFLSSIRDLGSTEILQLLIENGFNIHADNNMILTEWMGTSEIGWWGKRRPEKHDLLTFISGYYLEKPGAIEKFASLYPPDKLRLFRMGLDSNNLTMMKFAFVIGANENEALNSALYRHYANNNEHAGYEIIVYILNADIAFKKVTISNAVCFEYTEVLHALKHHHDLEYGYEMAYKYENDDLCEFFARRGVSKEARSYAKMKISAIKGNLRAMRQAVNEGADLDLLDTDVLVEVINENQVDSLKYLHDAGVLLGASLNQHLDSALNQHKAFDAVTYLIELGLDITSVKNIPPAYKKRYPAFADMWEKNFTDIFAYTMYLAQEVHPKTDGRKKEQILKRIAALSSLPYVIKMSKEKSLED